jgi:hypothetical protein
VAREDYDGETVATGRWLYDNIPMSIEIVAFDCDYYFERIPTAEAHAAGKVALNEDGCLYYIKACGGDVHPRPFMTINAAKRWAENQPWGVAWDQ